MGVAFESISIENDGIGITRFNIISRSDARILIGPHGEHLQALGTLIKHIARFDDSEKETFPCIIDVNDYQKTLIENLRNQTKIIAERVKLFKKELALPPMSPYERMIVHAVSTTIEGVTTRSEGKDRGRFIMIEPTKKLKKD